MHSTLEHSNAMQERGACTIDMFEIHPCLTCATNSMLLMPVSSSNSRAAATNGFSHGSMPPCNITMLPLGQVLAEEQGQHAAQKTQLGQSSCDT